MKNLFHLAMVAASILVVGLGCGFIGGDGSSGPEASNKTLTDKAVDTTVGRSNTGIPECDQVLDAIERELSSPDDNFMIKAAKATFLNRIKDSIRESIEKNPNDAAELAKTCTEYKAQFDKFKAEESSKQ
ncbi:MAG: hypothetical protein AB7F88_10710 [Pyrinomonadaceae bacterium]